MRGGSRSRPAHLMVPSQRRKAVVMNLSFLPRTGYGWRSILFAAGGLALGVAAKLIAAAQGNTIEYPNPINSPLLGTAIYLTFGFIAAAALTGLRAVRRQGERSLLVYAVTVFGGAISAMAAVMLVAGVVEMLGG